MPHGDFSDMAALGCLIGGFQSVLYPEFHFQSFMGGKNLKMTDEMEMMCSMVGGFMIVLGCMLFTVRWNTINGKMSGLACIGNGMNMAYRIFALDDKEFVFRPFYGYAALLVLAGLHMMFNANPVEKKPKKA